MFILWYWNTTPPTCTTKTCLFVRVPPVPVRRDETTRLCICPICLNKSLLPFGINLIFPARPCFYENKESVRSYSSLLFTHRHRQKDPKKIQKRFKHRLRSMQTQCTTVIPVFSQCCRKVTKTTNNVPRMYQHAPCTTIVPFFRQCLGHRQLFQGILQQRLVFRHLPRAPFAPDQHFSHLVQQFGVFAFGHGRGHFRRRSRLHGFVVPGKRTGSVHRSINRAKKQQKQQKQQQQQRLRRTLAGLPSRPPPRRRVCAGKKSRSVYILNRTKGLVNQSSSTNHRQPIIVNQSTNQPIIVKSIILKTIIVNQSTNHRQTINQSPSNHHRHTTTVTPPPSPPSHLPVPPPLLSTFVHTGRARLAPRSCGLQTSPVPRASLSTFGCT